MQRSEERRLKMLVEANAEVLESPRGRPFKEFSRPLLIPDRIHVDTAHVMPMCSTELASSNIFYILKLKK